MAISSSIAVEEGLLFVSNLFVSVVVSGGRCALRIFVIAAKVIFELAFRGCVDVLVRNMLAFISRLSRRFT